MLFVFFAASKVFALPEVLFTQNQNSQPFFFKLDGNKIYQLNKKKTIFELPEDSSFTNIYFKDNRLQIIYEKEAEFFQVAPTNKRIVPLNLTITDEVQTVASIILDKEETPHLIGTKHNKDQHRYQLIYTQPPSGETIIIAEGFDEIIEPKLQLIKTDFARVLLLTWQIKYFDRTELHYSTSLDLGKTFSSANKIDSEIKPFTLAYIDKKLSAVSLNDNLPLFEEIITTLPLEAEIVSPAKNELLNADNLAITYNLQTETPLLCVMDLKNNQTNKAWQLTKIVSPGDARPIAMIVPDDLASGNYELALSISDGFQENKNIASVAFDFDNEKPQITELEHETYQGIVTFKGKVSELPVNIAVEDKSLELTERNSLEVELPLTNERNIFTFEIKDAAGNFTILTREVVYNPASPEVTVSQPKNKTWYKSGATIIIEAKVFDAHGDITDGAAGKVFIDGEELEGALSFDSAEKTIHGFVSLPETLAKGKQTAIITITDRQGNTGQGNFDLYIDNQAPIIEADNNQFFTKAGDSITIKMQDPLSGIDPAASTISLTGLSPEITTSPEGATIIFTTDILLFEGSYEANIYARDNVGNSLELLSSSIIVDLTAPILSITSSLPAQTAARSLNIEGIVNDQYPGKIEIYNNNRLIQTINLINNIFSYNLILDQGTNNIEIIALDKAGNSDSYSASTIANIKSFGLIQKCINGPNPFSPKQDLPGAFAIEGRGMVFSYTLSQPAKVKIRIFDIVGTQIWYEEIDAAVSGVTAWSGVDSFGKVVGSGIYPYIFSATAGGQKEMRRGKIVIVN